VNVEITIERFADLREFDGALPNLERHTRCPVCSSAGGTDVTFLAASIATRWCQRCGHVYRSIRPSEEWYRDWYRSSWDTDGAVGSGAARLLLTSVRMARVARNPLSGIADVFAFCRPAFDRGAAVLDVGCGYGSMLRPFARAGCRTHGVEPSPHRARTARLLGAKVAQIPVEELTHETFNTTFDLVLTHHVLEHVVDPAEYLRRVSEVMSRGGWLYVAVPNAANDFFLQHAFYALHVHLFSRASLEHTLRVAGFAPERVSADHQLRILARLVNKSGVGDVPSDGGAIPPNEVDGVPSTESLLTRMFGPRYREYARRMMYCKWTILPPARMAREPYAVEWSPEREPLRDREIGFRSDDNFELPVVFTKRGGEGTTPFWVK
jgi:2-polyprenyl-3-methyl-5-hydroxy-6-metoxy-1,4-benzoquinol methylase